MTKSYSDQVVSTTRLDQINYLKIPDAYLNSMNTYLVKLLVLIPAMYKSLQMALNFG